MQVKETADAFVITVPKNKEQIESSSGKTFILASSGGFTQTGLSVDGKAISANVTLTRPNPDYVKPVK
jgi:hypothetical protein